MENNPELVEPGAKYFYSKILKNCNTVRIKYNNTLVNLSLLIGSIIISVYILSYRKRSRDYKFQKRSKLEQEKNEYILNKIAKFNKNKVDSRYKLVNNL
jgi:hypothetical protein